MNINCILSILAILIAFFVINSFYLKYNYQKLSPVKIIDKSRNIRQRVLDKSFRNVHELDSRYRYSELPPVNPMVNGSFVETNIPCSSDLYSSQTYTTPYTLLDQPDNITNELNYSGGSASIIKVPLQYNEPFEEPLRTQAILVNDFNKIKYGTC